MIKYYIRVVSSLFQNESTQLVVYAYSEEQLKDIFKEYEIISCTNCFDTYIDSIET